MGLAIPSDELQSVRVVMAREYDSSRYYRKKTTQQRTASYYEISYYLSGDGSVNINNVEYPISAGYVRFVKPGDLVFSTAPFSCFTINFEFSSEHGFAESKLFSSIAPYFAVRKDVGVLFSEFLECYQSDRAENYLMQSALLMQILVKMYRANEAPMHSPVIERCIQYMNDNLKERINLDELGELSGYSPLHFRRLFIASTGITPHEYLTSIRIYRAKELLMNTEMAIDAIAGECGFSSVANFKTLFKKKTQITPGKFRVQMNESF